jgi:aconitate hydratase
MGVLPLQFMPGESAASLGITGREIFAIEGLDESISPNSKVTIRMIPEDKSVIQFNTVARLNTAIEVDYYRNGGVLNTVIKKMQ